MNIANTQSLYIIIAFFVPGFIISVVKSKFSPVTVKSGTDALLYYLTYSAINHALFSAIIYIILFTDILEPYPKTRALIWFFLIFVGPMCIGAALGLMGRRQWLKSLLNVIGIQPIHEIPTAWDYCFSRMNQSNWIIVTLKDGSQLKGLFGTNSFASSSNSERDIMIEQIYQDGENGAWIPLKKGHGVLITKEQISCVEFWPV